MNGIFAFISGLNGGQKKLLIVTMVVVVAALCDRLLIAPTMSRLASINEDIAKEEDLIKRDLHFLSYKDRILQQSGEIAPYLTKSFSTDEEMIAGFLKKIENLAGRSKVTLIKVNPAPGEQETQFWKYQAYLECSGDLADVVTFMHLINTDANLMKVLKFNLSSKKTDSDEVKATMTIEKIVVPDKPMPPKPADTNPNAPPATTTPAA